MRNHKAHIARLKETQAPEVLTVNGQAQVVVQDAASYRSMLDRLDHRETIAAIQEGMASAERGELKPATQVLEECGPNMAYRVSLTAPAEADAYAAFDVSAKRPPCMRNNAPAD